MDENNQELVPHKSCFQSYKEACVRSYMFILFHLQTHWKLKKMVKWVNRRETCNQLPATAKNGLSERKNGGNISEKKMSKCC